MTDIRELTQQVLDDEFFGVVPVYAEDDDGGDNPTEYIVHDVIYAIPEDHANGVITLMREGVDVSYYCKTRSQKAERLEQIRDVMMDAGFLLVDGFSDVPRGEISGYYGATAEFVLYRPIGGVGDGD